MLMQIDDLMKNEKNRTRCTSHINAHELNTIIVRGYKYLSQGSKDDAVACFLAAFALAHSNPIILNNLGNALIGLKLYDEAQEAYEQAIAARPNYTQPYRNLALLHQIRQQNEQAIRRYRQYLQLAPEDGEAHHNLGLLYMTSGQTNIAREAFEKAEKYLKPENAERATNLGVGCFYRGNLQKAETLLQKALQFDPSHVPAHYHLGITYLHQGEFQKAIEMLKAVIATDPEHPQAAANLGVAYNSAGESQKAITIFERLLQKQPDNPANILNLGYAYQDVGVREKAIEYFNRVIEMCPIDSSLAKKAQCMLKNIQRDLKE